MDFYLKDNEIVRGNCVDYIQNLPSNKKWHVKVVEDKKAKTYKQRNYWHSIIDIISKEIGDTDLKMKIKYSVLELIEVKVGNDIHMHPPSSEDLDREQYSDLIEATKVLAMDLNITIPQPTYTGVI